MFLHLDEYLLEKKKKKFSKKKNIIQKNHLWIVSHLVFIYTYICWLSFQERVPSRFFLSTFSLQAKALFRFFTLNPVSSSTKRGTRCMSTNQPPWIEKERSNRHWLTLRFCFKFIVWFQFFPKSPFMLWFNYWSEILAIDNGYDT